MATQMRAEIMFSNLEDMHLAANALTNSVLRSRLLAGEMGQSVLWPSSASSTTTRIAFLIG
jgi:hypothetical protein